MQKDERVDKFMIGSNHIEHGRCQLYSTAEESVLPIQELPLYICGQYQHGRAGPFRRSRV